MVLWNGLWTAWSTESNSINATGEVMECNDEKYDKKIRNFYNSDGILKQYPAKRPLRMLALAEIAKCFENNRIYSEKQVNEIISKAIGFEDIEMIRRELYESKMINRKRDGSEYWLNDVSGTGIEI